MSLKACVTQAQSELKYRFFQLFALTGVIALFIHVVFGSGQREAAIDNLIIERFLPIICVFGLSTAFYPEHQAPLRDLLSIRQYPLINLYIIRIAMRFLFSFLLTFLFVLPISRQHSDCPLITITVISFGIGAMIGSVGLLVYSLSHNLVVALLVSVSLLLFQWFIPNIWARAIYIRSLPLITVDRWLLPILISIGLISASLYLITQRTE